MPCVVKQCTCSHEYQDKRYGRNNRVHNTAKGKLSDKPAHVCTVCGTKKEQ